ncbi:MAG: 4Fe-4S binding protein [Arenicellales bacterium]|nr:4Fe-4S binding protein [Pseudomonadales bacterium]MDP6267751.1 4Fe-4S binding protein [Arenicellales bacterium]MDP7451959.1 4Fe-4S binding protein [Arenicellales bacterium]
MSHPDSPYARAISAALRAACGACINECPNDAISASEPYIVDAFRCTECVGAEDETQGERVTFNCHLNI